MGVSEGRTEPGGFLLSGLVHEEAASVTRVLRPERMKRAEEIAAEIISCIQPNQTSERRRKAIISYIHRLITKCFSCQVFTFGSVPLKTYLPDGDIDLTVFSEDQKLSNSFINEVLKVLENEEKSGNAELCVKGVRYIQAEVKIIKCLVEDIVVDISFNQLGGLRTLYFLEKVDNLINGNHLFKRSVILIKAWCYYESRILGAHHGLISTYALEILVLYIFHAFNNKFFGPLEVLHRFLELFSKFDWGNFCISLWGPVPISSIHNMDAEPPRNDWTKLSLTKLFLDVCSSAKAAFPGGQGTQEQSFAPKYFNVVDPLCSNNNLGRSVSEGNFYRIRSAFALGAEQLARLLDCSREDLLINCFFMNTMGRREKGHYPDAPGPSHFGRQSMTFNQIFMSEGFRNYRGRENARGDPTARESTVQVNCATYASNGVLSQNKNQGLRQTYTTGHFSKVSRDLGQKTHARFHRSLVGNQNKKETDYLRNEIHVRYHFVRTNSSTNLMDSSRKVPQCERQIKTSETENSHIASAGSDNSRSMCMDLGVVENNNSRFLGEDSFSSSHSSAQNRMDAPINSKGTSNDNCDGCQAGTLKDEHHPLAERLQVLQIDGDLVTTLPFSGHCLDGENQMPMDSSYGHPFCPIKSLKYAKKGLASMCPTNEYYESLWSPNRQQSQGYFPFQVSKIFPGKMTPEHEKTSELVNNILLSSKLSQKDGDHGNLSSEVNSVRYVYHNEGNSRAQVQKESEQHKYSSHVSCSGSSSPSNPKIIAEDQDLIGRNRGENAEGQRTRETYVHTSSCLSSVPSSQVAKKRNKLSYNSYFSILPVKSNNSKNYKWQKKSELSKNISAPHGMYKNGLQCKDKSIDPQVNNNDQECVPCSTGGMIPTENMVSDGMVLSNIRMLAGLGCKSAPVTGSTFMFPVTQMSVDPQSDGRVDCKHETLQLKSHVEGPSVPFLTMLPIYIRPSDKRTKSSSRENFGRVKELTESEDSPLCQNFNTNEAIDQQELSNASKFVRDMTCMMSSEDHKSDSFNGDVGSHGQNLQQHDGLLLHPHSPMQVQPMESKENIPCNIGRSVANMNVFNQSGSYLPYPVSSANQKYSKPGNNRGNGNYDRKDYHFDCQGNWNKNSKPGIGNCSHSQTHETTMKMKRMAANKGEVR